MFYSKVNYLSINIIIMAVLIGIVTGASNEQLSVTVSDPATAEPKDSDNNPLAYGVGMFKVGMEVALTIKDSSVYTNTYKVTAFDVDNGTVDLNSVLGNDDAAELEVATPTGLEVQLWKLYAGAHGTVAEHARKRLLGYI